MVDTLTPPRALAPRTSPLAAYAHRFSVAGQDTTARLRERPFLAMIDLRIHHTELAALARVQDILGQPLPGPGRATGDPVGAAVLWLGPYWWLVVGPPDTQAGTAARLHTALDAAHASVVDVSAWRTTLELTGPRARDVLRTGCSIDLHTRAFPTGACAQTLLARAQVVLHATTPDTYRILVRASYATYLADWLLDAIEVDGEMTCSGTVGRGEPAGR